MNRPHHLPRPGGASLVAGAIVAALALSGCSEEDSAGGAGATVAVEGSRFYDDSLVHTISVEYDEGDYQAMLDALEESGDKSWISATVTIDGKVFENVGLRLKGNSSLRGLTGLTGDGGGPPNAGAEESVDAPAAPEWDGGDGNATSDEPESLPWLIRLDKYVDGQEYQGRTDFVVRGNTSESSLNEAVALHVVGLSGLVTEDAVAVRFSVNGGEERLRLVIESPDDEGWNEDVFGGDGITYKAESTGSYEYVGDDPADYVDVFEQKVPGGTDDLTPLMDFLDFVNNSTDEDFAADLGEHLDVDAFATYLAVQEIVANTDDIDGPGNNSYLRYDAQTGLMTVVTWDENLAYGAMGAMGGMPGTDEGMGGARPDGAPTDMPEGMTPPDGAPTDMPEGMTPPDGWAGREDFPGGMGGDNPLVTRFMANSDFAALYESELARLRDEVYADGDAQEFLDRWVDVLTEQASDLVDPQVVQEEADAIAAYFTAE